MMQPVAGDRLKGNERKIGWRSTCSSMFISACFDNSHVTMLLSFLWLPLIRCWFAYLPPILSLVLCYLFSLSLLLPAPALYSMPFVCLSFPIPSFHTLHTIHILTLTLLEVIFTVPLLLLLLDQLILASQWVTWNWGLVV